MNVLVAVAAAVAAFVVGGIYWAVATPAWSRSLGTPAEQGRPTPARLGVAFVSRVVVACLLAVFVGLTGVQGLGGGAEIGFLAWLGFVLPPALGQAAFEGRSWQVVAIGLPESLIGFLLMGVIVGAWA